MATGDHFTAPEHVRDRDALITTVIIPVYNGAETISQCLEGLRDQTVTPDEVLVIDDGSTDGTAEVVTQFPEVRLIRQDNSGPAAARNLGVAEAKGEVALMIDADCRPVPSWVEAMVRPFDDPSVVGVRGEYLSDQVELTAQWIQAEYEDRYLRSRGRERIDFIDTYSAGYRVEEFLAAGGFDTSIPTAAVEDQEFSFRLAADGHRLVHAEGAKVFHRHNRTPARYFRRKYTMAYWKYRAVATDPSKMVADSHTPQRLKAQVALAGVALGGVALSTISPSIGFRLLAGSSLATVLAESKIWPRLARRNPALLAGAPIFTLIRSHALFAGVLFSLPDAVRYMRSGPGQSATSVAPETPISDLAA